MPKLTPYRMDPALSVEGIWFDFQAGTQSPLEGPHPSNICFRVARWNNPRFRAERAAVLEVSQGHGDAGDLLRKANAKAMSRYVLIDWSNVDRDDGTPWAYSPEDAEKILLDDAYDQVRQFIIECATRVDLFRSKLEDDAAGN